MRAKVAPGMGRAEFSAPQEGCFPGSWESVNAPRGTSLVGSQRTENRKPDRGSSPWRRWFNLKQTETVLGYTPGAAGKRAQRDSGRRFL